MRFSVKRVIDFSYHNRAKEVAALRNYDWSHVFVTERTLTMDNKTYNLATKLAVEFEMPKHYFGKETSLAHGRNPNETYSTMGSMMTFEYESNSENSDQEDEDDKNEWKVSSVQGMSLTINMITLAQRNHRNFCFVIKPAPGSRKISIVGF